MRKKKIKERRGGDCGRERKRGEKKPGGGRGARLQGKAWIQGRSGLEGTQLAGI